MAEWVVALGVVGGAAWVGAPLVQRWLPPLSSSVTLVESALPALPDGVPVAAESVPFLMLLDGAVVRLGMSEADLTTGRISRWAAGPATAEKGIFDERLILPYRSAGTRFWVVLDRTEVGKDRQVTAIYVA